MTLEQNETALTASFDGTEIFRYVYKPADAQLEAPRPYLHPVRTLGGDIVSRYRPDDHVWHKGISLSLPHVGSHNFWGGPTWRDGEYTELPNVGSMVHGSFETAEVTDGVARIGERLTWVPEDTSYAIFIEHRRIAATAWPSDKAWCLAFETELANVSGEDIVIGSPTTEGRPDAGYGGLFWRGPESFTGGTVLTPDGPGGDEVMGRRGPWLGFVGQHSTGQHDGTGGASTLVFRDHPENPRHPVQWFVRSTPFACVGPAPFFDTEYVFGAGAWLTLRYDIVIADGALDVDECAAFAERAAGKDLLS